MAKRTYPIMLQPADGGYGVVFPDLPGCVSFGSDYDTAISGAEEALSLHLEGMAEDGEAFPAATPMADLILDHPDRTADTVWALASAEAPDTSERVNIYMAKSLLERIDRFVGAEGGRNRSTFFSIAARRYLEAETVSTTTAAQYATWMSGLSVAGLGHDDPRPSSLRHWGQSATIAGLAINPLIASTHLPVVFSARCESAEVAGRDIKARALVSQLLELLAIGEPESDVKADSDAGQTAGKT